MKLQQRLREVLFFVLLSSSPFSFSEKNTNTLNDLYPCENLAEKIKNLSVKKDTPIYLTDVERLATWRASCYEAVPTTLKNTHGKVTILCQGNGTKQNGETKGFFYWEKEGGKIGYVWCENPLSQ